MSFGSLAMDITCYREFWKVLLGDKVSFPWEYIAFTWKSLLFQIPFRWYLKWNQKWSRQDSPQFESPAECLWGARLLMSWSYCRSACRTLWCHSPPATQQRARRKSYIPYMICFIIPALFFVAIPFILFSFGLLYLCAVLVTLLKGFVQIRLSL